MFFYPNHQTKSSKLHIPVLLQICVILNTKITHNEIKQINFSCLLVPDNLKLTLQKETSFNTYTVIYTRVSYISCIKPEYAAWTVIHDQNQPHTADKRNKQIFCSMIVSTTFGSNFCSKKQNVWSNCESIIITKHDLPSDFINDTILN